MDAPLITTPFGRRPMALAMMKSQIRARHARPEQAVDKWKIYRALCEAKPLLGLTDRALAVLNALLSFYPKTELSSADRLVVFPSNAQLSLRAHGMAEQTLRRHIALLVEVGLILRKDSPNGKRYARKDLRGNVSDAYGFSLEPLVARAGEIEQLAARVLSDRLAFQQLRERVSICRRDIAKLIDAALREDLPGDWEARHSAFRAVIDSVPRSPSIADLDHAMGQLLKIRHEITNVLEQLVKSGNAGGSCPQNERHIQNSHPESYLESEGDQSAALNANEGTNPGDDACTLSSLPADYPPFERDTQSTTGPTISLNLILQACPEIVAYGPQGVVATWNDFIQAATLVQRMLGISSTAFSTARETMGTQNAAVVIACMLERASAIRNAGGYLRDLTRRYRNTGFSVGPMLFALARSKRHVGPRNKDSGVS